ncbi:MAG TPA: hypothetical protein VFD70_16155 [Anaerolineae bacterium]|nr:hypothetical protein [Anaerolineae bacterium]
MKAIKISNGRIVIPLAIRQLGIRTGTRIHTRVDEKTRKIILTPMKSLMAEKRRENL